MALFNYASKEITLKVVYYGPGLSGKTTNLQYLHPKLDKTGKAKLLSLATEADRTLFFDFLPIELGKIKDFSIRFQLYTVPGQVKYNSTRKLVLKGADAVVFIADSQIDMREQNIESFMNMKENLIANNINIDETPIVLQYNKRDLEHILSEEELDLDLNDRHYQYVLASAVNGTGVEETFQLVTRLLIKDIARKHKVSIEQSNSPEAQPLPASQESEMRKPAPPLTPQAQIVPPPPQPAPSFYSWGEVEKQADEESQPVHPQKEEEAELEGLYGSPPTETFEAPPFETRQSASEMKAPAGKKFEDDVAETLERDLLQAVSADSVSADVAFAEQDDMNVCKANALESRINELGDNIINARNSLDSILMELKLSRSDNVLMAVSKVTHGLESIYSEMHREFKEIKAKQEKIEDELKEINVILKSKGKKGWF